ncbi:MAG: magnesium transporter, partial [Actinobacteria bacterium]|nr:magnesium transporter [Actinomycetota bacterium]
MSRVPRPSLPRPDVSLPAPVARLLTALGLPVTATAEYWRQERRAIRDSASALGVGLLATLVAGTVLGSATGQLEEAPGLLALIPAAIGMRGSIFGALAARLGTGILTGEFEGELRRASFLGRQIEAVTILSVTTATQAGILAWIISTLLGLPVIPVLELIAISLVGGLISSVFLLLVTIGMARSANERGWNIDDVGAPIITATGDLITLPALLLATLLLRVPIVADILGAIGLLAGLATLVLGWRHETSSIRRIVRESLVVLTFAVSLQVFAGTVIESRLDRFLDVPSLLVLIPAFVATCGSLGGMLSARLSSKLHVGLLQPRTVPSKLAALDVSVTFLLAVIAFVGVGGIGWFAANLAGGVDPPPAYVLVGVALVGGLIATFILAFVAYGAAVATFRFGLDPDNHGIPIVTATMDLAGIL